MIAQNIIKETANCQIRPEPSVESRRVVRLGSTRVVRFSASARRPRNEPGDVATGPQDAEISGCFEPMGAEGTVGIGSRRGVGDVGTAVPALPGSLRVGRAGRTERQAAGEGLGETCAGR